MSLTAPAISNASVVMEVLPAILNPIAQDSNINIPMFFNSVANLELISGSFTPNNNILNVVSAIPNSSAPNFIMLITDGQANLTINSGPTVLVNSNPVMKVYVNCMNKNSTYNITDIILDGTTSAVTPMAQNVQVNYTLVYCQADIS
jgi:hypothetical protein